jgi:malate dehydrogenase (quinone)
MNTPDQPYKNITLIGGGIMSATLGILLKELNPHYSITIYERLNEVAAESSAAMNNAGTGHSAFCELNYTPEKEDGSVDISKAAHLNYQNLSGHIWLMKNILTSLKISSITFPI